jgi:hypothetical protein
VDVVLAEPLGHHAEGLQCDHNVYTIQGVQIQSVAVCSLCSDKGVHPCVSRHGKMDKSRTLKFCFEHGSSMTTSHQRMRTQKHNCLPEPGEIPNK